MEQEWHTGDRCGSSYQCKCIGSRTDLQMLGNRIKMTHTKSIIFCALYIGKVANYLLL